MDIAAFNYLLDEVQPKLTRKRSNSILNPILSVERLATLFNSVNYWWDQRDKRLENTSMFSLLLSFIAALHDVDVPRRSIRTLEVGSE